MNLCRLTLPAFQDGENHAYGSFDVRIVGRGLVGVHVDVRAYGYSQSQRLLTATYRLAGCCCGPEYFTHTSGSGLPGGLPLMMALQAR